jgi:hypothetical protein
MKSCGEVDVLLKKFLSRTLDTDKWLNLPQGNGKQYPLNKRLGWFDGRSERFRGKISFCSAGNQSTIPQSSCP